MYKTLVNSGISTISTGAGFLPSNVGIYDFHKFRTTAAFFPGDGWKGDDFLKERLCEDSR